MKSRQLFLTDYRDLSITSFLIAFVCLFSLFMWNIPGSLHNFLCILGLLSWVLGLYWLIMYYRRKRALADSMEITKAISIVRKFVQRYGCVLDNNTFKIIQALNTIDMEILQPYEDEQKHQKIVNDIVTKLEEKVITSNNQEIQKEVTEKAEND